MSAVVPAKAAKTLKAVYDACLGAASEFDAFDGFYEGGADQLLADFASALKAIGVRTLGPGEGRADASASRIPAACAAISASRVRGVIRFSSLFSVPSRSMAISLYFMLHPPYLPYAEILTEPGPRVKRPACVFCPNS